jgi:hypothetical protein
VDVISRVQVRERSEITRFDDAILALATRRDRLLRSIERRRKDFAQRAGKAFENPLPRDTVRRLSEQALEENAFHGE